MPPKKRQTAETLSPPATALPAWCGRGILRLTARLLKDSVAGHTKTHVALPLCGQGATLEASAPCLSSVLRDSPTQMRQDRLATAGPQTEDLRAIGRGRNARSNGVAPAPVGAAGRLLGRLLDREPDEMSWGRASETRPDFIARLDVSQQMSANHRHLAAEPASFGSRPIGICASDTLGWRARVTPKHMKDTSHT